MWSLILGNSVQLGGSVRRGRRVLAEEVATEDPAQERAGLIVEPIKFTL